MSRRPTPVEIKQGTGTLRKSREPAAVPQRVSGTPKAPKRFKGFALEFWTEHAELLRARGQLSRDTRASLEALCECYAEWRELQEDLATNGRFQKVKTGSDDTMERARPALAAYQDADRRLKGWLIEFGLTDASRGKVHAEPPDDDENDPLAAYGLN